MNPVTGLLAVYRSAFSGLSREMWMLAMATFVNRAGTMVLPFLSLYLTRSLGFSPTQAGYLLGLFGFGSMVGSYAGGWLSDRLSPVRVQQLSLVLSGVGFLVLSRLSGIVSLAVAITAVSVVADAFRPALMVAVAHHSIPETRPRAFALIRLAINLGMTVGPAVGGFLALRHYSWLFIGDAATCWCGAVLLAVTLSPSAGTKEAADSGDRKAAAGSPWRDPPFLLFLLLIVILGVVFFQIFTTLPLYLKDVYHFSESAIGSLLAFNALLVVAFEMVLLRRIEQLNALKIIAWGTLLVGLGLAILPFGSAVLLAMLSVAIWSFGEMLCLPTSNSIVADRAGSTSAGRYMGAYTLAFSSAFVIAPIIGTLVYQHLGGRALWYGIGAICAFLSISFSHLARHLGRDASTTSSGA